MSKSSFKAVLAALLPDNSKLRTLHHRTANDVMVDMFYEPEGIPKPYIGIVAPDGYHLLNGGEISRTENPMLFALWGTTYGNGNGTTTFNVPNFPQGTCPVQCGVDFPLASKGGSSKHTNTIEEMVSHDHDMKQDDGDDSVDGKYIFFEPKASGTLKQKTGKTGDGAEYSIMNPYFAVNWIIQLK